MRLREVYSICVEYMKKIPEMNVKELFQEKYRETGQYIINDDKGILKYILQEFEMLGQVNVLKPTLDELKGLMTTEKAINYRYTLNEKSQLMRGFRDLLVQLETIVNVCEGYGYADEEYVGFDIKVPDQRDFSSITKNLNDFNKIMKQSPFLNKCDAVIEYRKIDLGSTWIEFGIRGAAAASLLHIFAKFVDNCIKILSHKKNCQKQEAEYRRMEIDNKLIESMSEAHQKMTEALTNKYIEQLSGKLDPEEQARAQLCFDMMVELLDKGMEIHHAITKNESNTLLFPTSEQWKEISGNLPAAENIEEKSNCAE